MTRAATGRASQDLSGADDFIDVVIDPIHELLDHWIGVVTDGRSTQFDNASGRCRQGQLAAGRSTMSGISRSVLDWYRA
jgi:hypothetical protein